MEPPSAPSPTTVQPSFTPTQIAQLRAQVNVYRLLARNEAIPTELAIAAMPPKPKPTSLLPEPYEYGSEIENGERLPYDLMKNLAIQQQRSQRATQVSLPSGIDPLSILKEREHRS